MLILSLIIALTWAQESAAPEAPEPATAEATEDTLRQRQAGDLVMEGVLATLGIAPENAVELSTEWLPAISAPKRAQLEQRSRGWDFDVARVWVTERSVHTGEVLLKSEASGNLLRADPCAELQPVALQRTELQPLPPAPTDEQAKQDLDTHRSSITMAPTESERIMFLTLQPGESALLVEVIPNEGVKRRGKAKVAKRLSMDVDEASISLKEQQESRDLCVNLKPAPEWVVVSLDEVSLETQVRQLKERLQEGREDEDPTWDTAEPNEAPPAP